MKLQPREHEQHQLLPAVEVEELRQRGDVLKEGVAARKGGAEQGAAFVLKLQHRVKQECSIRYMRLQSPNRIITRGVELEHLTDNWNPLLAELDGLVYFVVCWKEPGLSIPPFKTMQ